MGIGWSLARLLGLDADDRVDGGGAAVLDKLIGEGDFPEVIFVTANGGRR